MRVNETNYTQMDKENLHSHYFRFLTIGLSIFIVSGLLHMLGVLVLPLLLFSLATGILIGTLIAITFVEIMIDFE